MNLPQRRRIGRLGLAGFLSVTMAGCFGGGGSTIEQPATPVIGPPVVYVAIGASETAGVGTRDPFTDAWPKVLWRESLPEAVLYDLGRAGSTLSEAIVEQLDEAIAVEPDVITVWLNVNDLVAKVPASEYERELRVLLTALSTETDATVLVADTPQIDSLPIYLACLPDPPVDGPTCPTPGLSVPSPAQVRSAVEAYNEVIDRVAGQTGAIVVDLHAYGEAPITHPEWIADDGFHPSTEGAREIADAFGRALPAEVIDAASQPR
jgi:lysophospholipase L1-like esterase